MKSDNLLTAALAYAREGWPVLIIWWIKGGKCACGNAHCQNPGKHPITKNGVKDATTDLQVIRRWLRKYPSANIASPLVEGLSVIDVDGDKGKASAERIGLREFKTAKVITGRGYHKYAAVSLKTKIGALAGLDIKSGGSNGYVILPPSRHHSGTYYRWGNFDKICPLPALIKDNFLEHREVEKPNYAQFDQGNYALLQGQEPKDVYNVH